MADVQPGRGGGNNAPRIPEVSCAVAKAIKGVPFANRTPDERAMLGKHLADCEACSEAAPATPPTPEGSNGNGGSPRRGWSLFHLEPLVRK